MEKKVVLGRPKNNLKMGLVGLPNVGKSTTFNVLSNLSVPAENYPFCTKDPHLAKINVPDQRFEKLVQMYQPKNAVQASLEIRDIAGLVRGASMGEGLGNAFLSHIKEVDGIYHVVRAFEDEIIIHEEGDVNPIRDMEIIWEELILKDLSHAEKALEEVDKVIKRTNAKQAKDEADVLQRCIDLFKEKKWVRDGEWSGKDIEWLNTHYFLTAKSVVYLVNVSVSDYKSKKNKFLPKIVEWVKERGGDTVIPYSAEYEKTVLDNAGTDPETRKKFCSEEGAISMINRIIKQGYTALRLMHFFTAGEDEVKCWTIREGTKAPKAAGTIHTDFEKGFICAEVMRYEDLMELGSEGAVKAEGKYRQQGKEYEILDGDVVYFKFNVSHSKKK